ncbi:phosphatase PAP2 family protein [Pontibacillus salicampi]|uniref:Phosphatase PAP2 family protein n=1 Tax=Pontibacillus salicampi TaxID=1449801 RepID=A0ABV6LKE5_9BACI
MELRKARPSELPKLSISLLLIGFIVIGFGFYLFGELAEDVLEEEKFAIDQVVQNQVNSFQTPWLNTAFRYITEAGSVLWLTIVSVIIAVFLLFSSNKSMWNVIYFAIGMLGISLMTKLLKVGFERQRPDVLDQYDGTGFSFPSGHATGSLLLYGFLIYFVSLSPWNRIWKTIVNIMLTVLILLIGLSRVYLGVHYVTDIAAGFLLGLSWLIMCIIAIEITVWRKRK